MGVHIRILCLLCALAASGCSSGTDAGEAETAYAAVRAAAQVAQAAGHDSQYAILRDGEVTEAEYSDAVDRTRACLRDAGLGLTELVLNPVDGLRLLYGITPNGQSQDVMNTLGNDCPVRESALVEVQYLATHRARMDLPLLDATARCLTDGGYYVSGMEVNVRDLIASVGPDSERVVADCVTESARSLYPDLPSIIVNA